MDAKTKPTESALQPKASKLPSRRTVIASVVALAIAIGGAVWIALPPSAESTDDAYIGGDIASISRTDRAESNCSAGPMPVSARNRPSRWMSWARKARAETAMVSA